MQAMISPQANSRQRIRVNQIREKNFRIEDPCPPSGARGSGMGPLSGVYGVHLGMPPGPHAAYTASAWQTSSITLAIAARRSLEAKAPPIRLSAKEKNKIARSQDRGAVTGGV
jgi:hypothetical protein